MAKAKLKIAYLSEIELPRLTSMQVYANQIRQNLSVETESILFRLPQVTPFPMDWIYYRDPLAKLFKQIHRFEKYCLYPKLAKVIERWADVVHIINQGYAHVIPHLSKPTILTCHDLHNLESANTPAPQTTPDYRIYQHMEDAHAVICVSEFTKSQLLRFYPAMDPASVHVIHHGVPPGLTRIEDQSLLEEWKLRYNIPLASKIFFHVGHTGPVKNIETVIRVLYEFKKRHPSTPFVFVKAGEYLTPAQMQLTRSLGLESELIQFGKVSPVLLNILYNLADILLFPSLSEGFGWPLIEAMHTGCVVISSDKGSIPEIVGDAGLVCDPLDVETMVYDLSRVCSDQTLEQELIMKGLRRAKLFSQQDSSRRVLEIYKQLASV